MIKRKFSIPDMFCPACAMHLQALEDDLPGVKSISASYRKQEMVVEYDEAILTDEEIIAAALKIGYTAQVITG